MTGQSDSRRTLLIVEDDRLAADSFRRLLSTRGYRIVTTHSEEDALAAIERESPSAVLTDLHLPMNGGVEILRQLRGSPGHARTPVALMTGDYFLDETIAHEIRSLGARIYFKPIWEEDLVRIAQDLLGNSDP